MTNRVQKVQPPSNLIATLQSFSIKAGMAVALIGYIVILGWIFDIAILKSVLPGLVTMKANTAVSFILSGSSLWLLGRRRIGKKWNKLGFIQPEILAISVITISLLTLIQYGFNLNFGIDQLLFKESATAVATAAPGRMAPNTALTFLLLGYSLLMLSFSRSRYILTQGFSLAGFLIALLGFLGYIYGNSSLYRAGSYTAMAIHTASGFLLLSLGILLTCPDRGLMAIITSKNAGGIVARQLLPAVIILPPVIGKLILVIFSPRFYSAEWLICLFAVFNIVIFGGLLWWNARKIGIVDRQRYEAEIKLQEANEELENRVLERTANLQSANEMLHQQIITNQQTEEALKQSEEQYREQATLLEKSLRDLQKTQAQLIQTEKISSLGMLVAGVAHEINNPINFIYGNITYATNYANDLLNFIQLYQQYYPNPTARIQEEAENIELDYLIEDFPKILDSMKLGADRIRDLVVSLRNFSRLDEAEMKSVNIHEGIESTLLMLKHRLKATPEMPAIKVIKEYGDLPLVECYPGQLNQVFMNLIANAIDAIEEYNSQRSFAEIKSNPNCIHIRTQVIDQDWVEIRIDDNGPGMNEAVWRKLFDPFFTTKAIGKGTGLGLSISYQIVVEKHRGKLQCSSTPGEGAEFVIQIPIQQ